MICLIITQFYEFDIDMLKKIEQEPIMQDQTLIQLAKKALGSKRPYDNTQADITDIRDWLNREVPLIHWFDVTTPKQLRESGKKEELYVALQVINNEIKPSVLFDLKEKYQAKKLTALQATQ